MPNGCSLTVSFVHDLGISERTVNCSLFVSEETVGTGTNLSVPPPPSKVKVVAEAAELHCGQPGGDPHYGGRPAALIMDDHFGALFEGMVIIRVVEIPAPLWDRIGAARVFLGCGVGDRLPLRSGVLQRLHAPSPPERPVWDLLLPGAQRS